MALATVADFVATLQCLPLLTAEQLNQLPALQQQFPDIKTLGQELIRRQWLTLFQANQVGKGRGQELLFEQYIVLDLLGEGGMGVVFKARQARMDRLVALKVIRREAFKSKGVVERFQREVRAAAKLAHPNVVTVFDSRENNGIPFMSTSATRSQATSPISTVTIRIPMLPKRALIWSGPRPSDPTSRTALACTTCTETSGNCALTGIAPTTLPNGKTRPDPTKG